MEEKKLPDKKISASTKEHSVVGDLGKYVMEEYIIPKTKDVLHDTFAGIASMCSDAVQGALNKAFYGEDNHTRRSGSSAVQRTGYTTYSRPASQTSSTVKRDSVGNRSSVEVKYIWVDDEQSARDIISSLKELIDNYDKAKVADLYGMLTPKVQTSFTDFKYGWTDASQFGYHKEYTGEHRGQYLIDLPRPIDVTNV